MNTSVTIIIPIYNDWESLEILLDEISQIQYHSHFLIVDNGSSDSSKIFEVKSKLPANCQILRSEKNLGFGGGIKYGFLHTDSNWIAWMPGNLKVKPRDLKDIVESLAYSSQDFIKAKRVQRNLLASIKTFSLGIVQSMILRKNLLDAGGTPTFVNRKHLDLFFNGPNDYSFESFCLYQARINNLVISRPNVNYGNRLFGSSHWQKGFRSEVILFFRIIKNSFNW